MLYFEHLNMICLSAMLKCSVIYCNTSQCWNHAGHIIYQFNKTDVLSFNVIKIKIWRTIYHKHLDKKVFYSGKILFGCIKSISHFTDLYFNVYSFTNSKTLQFNYIILLFVISLQVFSYQLLLVAFTEFQLTLSFLSFLGLS